MKVNRVRIVKQIRNQVIFWGVVALVGYGAYQLLLDREAKESLAAAGSSLKRSYQQLTGIVNARIGTIMDDDLVEQNRQKIKQDWADLGF